MPDKPAGELVPLARVAAIDGQTRLGVLVLGIFKVRGDFLVQILREMNLIPKELRSSGGNLWFKCEGGENSCEFHDDFHVEADFNNGGKIFPADVVLCLQVQVT